ncbi:hypothetical protein ABK040_002403 [Willaertia magna]
MSENIVKHLQFKRILVASDHAAYALKEHIFEFVKKEHGHKLEKLENMGVFSDEPVDYPDVAKEFCTRLQSNEFDGGILLCGTGLGTSISANKFKGIRAGLCHDDYTAEMSRRHNNANVICFGGRTTGPVIAERMTNLFLTTKFDGGRHEERLKRLADAC